MKTKLLLLFISAALLAGCNKASIIEGVGTASGSNGGGGTTARPVSLTVYSTGGVWRAGQISVYVDGTFRGTISEDVTSDPPCGGASSARALTIQLPPGTHTISARGARGGSWSESSVTINSGKCMRYELEG